MSKTWAALMTPVTSTKNMVGRSIGSVMRQNRCQEVAPSVRAAEWISAGIGQYAGQEEQRDVSDVGPHDDRRHHRSARAGIGEPFDAGAPAPC